MKVKISFISPEVEELYRTVHTKNLTAESFKDDAGIDLRALSTITLSPGQRAMIPVGISAQFSKKYVGILKDRSGMARSSNLVIHAGVIDDQYRGEINVIVQNHGPEPYYIHYGDRFAQMLIIQRFSGKIKFVSKLNQTKRGTKGFGSSGKR